MYNENYTYRDILINGVFKNIEDINSETPLTGYTTLFAKANEFYKKDELGNITPLCPTGSTSISLSDLTDVDLSGVTTGQTLIYDGSNWVNSGLSIDLSNYYTKGETNANFLSANTSLTGLSDVTLTTPTSNQILKYDGSKWINSVAPGQFKWVVTSGGTDLIYNMVQSASTGDVVIVEDRKSVV